MVTHRLAQSGKRYTERQAGSGRSKDVASVKGIALPGEAIAEVGEGYQLFDRFAGHHIAEDAVIRADEDAGRCAQGDRPACTAHPGIHDDQVDGVWWEIGIHVVEDKGSLAHVVGCDFVGNIYHLGPWGDAQNHPFNSPHISIRSAEISDEGHQRYLGHSLVTFRWPDFRPVLTMQVQAWYNVYGRVTANGVRGLAWVAGSLSVGTVACLMSPG
jgi:hypothetical protein